MKIQILKNALKVFNKKNLGVLIVKTILVIQLELFLMEILKSQIKVRKLKFH